MAKYEVIAFYKKDVEEISVHAEQFGSLFGLDVRYEVLPGSASVLSALQTEKTVFGLFNKDYLSVKKLLKYVYALTRPSLIISSSYSPDAFKRLTLQVGYLPENKEKVVWANFLQRSNPSVEIELVVPTESDDEIAKMVSDNLFFTENVLNNSKATFHKRHATEATGDNLKAILKSSADSTVFIMRTYRLFSFFVPFRLRLFAHYACSPVLIIPRDEDLYVPCH